MKTTAISIPITAHSGSGESASRQDLVAVEDPLQIRIGRSRVAITMRTPGHDRELAAGFLFTEGILARPDQIKSIATPNPNEAIVLLQRGAKAALAGASRNFYVSSSCGVCGKASIDAVRAQGCRTLEIGSLIDPAVIRKLPDKLRAAQPTFDRTGGLHAAGLFDHFGELLAAYEDVGRHNAVDKLIGSQFLAGRTPLSNQILAVSGRTSFELVQKAVMAGIPMLVAVGAPSSLAVELAIRFRLTLCGFVRNDRFNIYAVPERLATSAA